VRKCRRRGHETVSCVGTTLASIGGQIRARLDSSVDSCTQPPGTGCPDSWKTLPYRTFPGAPSSNWAIAWY
jgi:hypothetical protein